MKTITFFGEPVGDRAFSEQRRIPPYILDMLLYDIFKDGKPTKNFQRRHWNAWCSLWSWIAARL